MQGQKIGGVAVSKHMFSPRLCNCKKGTAITDIPKGEKDSTETLASAELWMGEFEGKV